MDTDKLVLSKASQIWIYTLFKYDMPGSTGHVLNILILKKLF